MELRNGFHRASPGLTGHHVEKDLEDAILRELEAFILEPRDGFPFVARLQRSVGI
jgi:predicted nuclease of restriction endonuclease-like (RecB) superfamily